MVTGPAIEVRGLSVFYGDHPALKGVTFDVVENEILAIIGPAQAGKTTLLRVLNRTIDFVPSARFYRRGAGARPEYP